MNQIKRHAQLKRPGVCGNVLCIWTCKRMYGMCMCVCVYSKLLLGQKGYTQLRGKYEKR